MGIIEDALADFVVNHFEGEFEEVEGLKDELRDLQSKVGDLEDKIDQLLERDQVQESEQEEEDSEVDEEKVKKSRVSPSTLKSMRDRFDLTQKELAELLDVSPQSITSWETGKNKPGKKNKAKIVELRDKSKGEVQDLLESEEDDSSGATAQQIRSIRKDLGLNQDEFAEELDVSSGTVSNWETGSTSPSSDLLDKMKNLEVEEESEEEVEFSDNDIKQLREEHDLTQSEIAEKLGVSPTTVSNWETSSTSPDSDRQEEVKSLQNQEETGEQEESEITGEDIKQLRNELGLSQKEFAEQLGVSPTTVSNWETGSTNPSSDRIEEIKNLDVEETEEDDVEFSAEDIKKLREKHDLTQQELAEEVGVSSATVSNWERGTSEPGKTAIEKLRKL